MSKKRYMPARGTKQACQSTVSQTASARDGNEASQRISISGRYIWVEGHYSPFGNGFRDGKVVFHHSDHGGCWEDSFSSQDLREIADVMDRHNEEERRKEEA